MPATPLAGLKVLEFTHTVMGPTAGLIMAELGADVVKVEPAPKGDHTRGLGGFGAGFFAAFNRNKRSLAVDLKRPEGQAVIPALQEVIGRLPQAEVEQRSERASVSWAPVAQPGDLFDDPHLMATGGLVDVLISRFGGDDANPTRLPALPIEFGADRSRPGIASQPPRIGEHNAAILGEAGFASAEIAALAESGVIIRNT